ncbi:transposase [Muricoccus vinaceus]|uniref:Transposase n=1 Tax=Muricoccus vinaceus TaxID=424704 RepID=A0ABV6IVQ9_9PROT
MECCEGRRSRGRGHPSASLLRQLATLRVFLREGTPWLSLRATPERASGSILLRCLAAWPRTSLLGRVNALLARLLRGHPNLILESCSVRAKRGRDTTGPNPTARAKQGSKYHVATTGDGLPVACAVTGANVPDTLLFERLFLAAFAVLARIRTVLADKGYDAKRHRGHCRKFSVRARIHKRGWAPGSGLGKRRWPVERTNAWLLKNRRLALRYDRCDFIIQSMLQTAYIFLAAGRLARKFWKPPVNLSSMRDVLSVDAPGQPSPRSASVLLRAPYIPAIRNPTEQPPTLPQCRAGGVHIDRNGHPRRRDDDGAPDYGPGARNRGQNARTRWDATGTGCTGLLQRVAAYRPQ